jgi:hypothetical protein
VRVRPVAEAAEVAVPVVGVGSAVGGADERGEVGASDATVLTPLAGVLRGELHALHRSASDAATMAVWFMEVSSVPFLGEVGKQLVEQLCPTRQARFVLAVQEREPCDLRGESRRLWTIELPVLHVDVVDELGDRSEARLLHIEARAEDLERAEVALV